MQSEGDQILIERDINFKIADNFRNQLEELDIVLQRIKEKKFTKCSMCGNEIPPARLRIRPNSIYCVICSAKVSQIQKTPERPVIEE
jgi:DnaK suppressor protein